MSGDKNDNKSTGKKVVTRGGGLPMSPFAEMDRMFDTFFSGWPRGWLRPSAHDWPAWGEHAPFEGRTPKVDVIDRDHELVVRAELPGVRKEDLDVTMSDSSITIRASTHYEDKEEKGEYYRSEMSRGEFSRTVGLPAKVHGKDTRATFKDGILELVLPKDEESRRHTVKVE